MTRTAIVAIGLLLAAAAAQGTTVTVMRDGVPVPAEICRFAAGHAENPFRRWLTSPDVVCNAAGNNEFTRGLWNVFARTPDSISASPVLVDGNSANATLTLSLDPAGAISPLLPDGAGGVVYVPRRGSAFPIRNAERALVPAGEEMWLFVIEKGAPSYVVPIAAIDRGAERSVDARRGGPAAIVGWLQVPESDREALGRTRGLSAPMIRASSGGTTHDADPLPPLDRLNGAFFRVREPAAGDGELKIGGRGFVPQRRPIRVESALTIVPEPLVVRAAGTLIVNWSVAPGTITMEQSLGACDEGREPSRFFITVSSCARPRQLREAVDPATCTAIREEPFDPRLGFGDVTIEDVPAGFYRAEMHFGKLPPIDTTTTVLPLQVQHVSLSAHYFEVYGSVTFGGESIDKDVTISFPDGYGFARKGEKEYHAALVHPLPPDRQVKVGACEGSPQAVVFTDRPIGERTRCDLDIPDNGLIVSVSDTFTREPLDGASVRLTIMSIAFPRRPLMTRTVSTTSDAHGAAGRAAFDSLPPDHEIRIVVSHSGYQSRTLDPFSMTKSDRKEFDVQLVPLRGSQSKIVSETPFDNGVIVWFSPAGLETERVELGPDGTFVYGSSHSSDETMAVVSASHALWVTRSPSLDHRKAATIAFPNAPSADIMVTVRGGDGRDVRTIGAIVGGVRVPQPVLRQHLGIRRLQPVVRGGLPMRLLSILATGPIDVLLGPAVQELSGRVQDMDFFALPQFANVPRQRLSPGAVEVVFDVNR